MSDDRRAAIEAAMSATEAEQSPAAQEPVAAEVVKDAPQETSQEATERAARERDDRGRYMAKDKPAEPAAIVPADSVADIPAFEPEKPKRAFPKTWRASLAPKFDTLDDEVVAEIERREGDMFKGLEQYRTKAQRADAYERAVQPFMATLQSQGLQPEVAVQSLLAADHRLRYAPPHEKAALFAKMARDYGVDLQNMNVEMPQVDPTVYALQQQVSQMHQQQQSWLREQQQQQQAQLTGTINDFASKNRFFEHVREDMAALLQAGRAQDLQEAYDRAVWSNPETRKALQAEQQAATVAADREKAQRAANAAKTAGVSVAGAPVQGATAPNPNDRRATIAAAMSQRA